MTTYIGGLACRSDGAEDSGIRGCAAASGSLFNPGTSPTICSSDSGRPSDLADFDSTTGVTNFSIDLTAGFEGVGAAGWGTTGFDSLFAIPTAVGTTISSFLSGVSDVLIALGIVGAVCDVVVTTLGTEGCDGGGSVCAGDFCGSATVAVGEDCVVVALSALETPPRFGFESVGFSSDPPAPGRAGLPFSTSFSIATGKIMGVPNGRPCGFCNGEGTVGVGFDELEAVVDKGASLICAGFAGVELAFKECVPEVVSALALFAFWDCSLSLTAEASFVSGTLLADRFFAINRSTLVYVVSVAATKIIAF